MEQTTTQESLKHEGFYPDTSFVDKPAIEARAWQLIERRRQMPAVEVRRQERRDNARTALMEALTASGHLSRVEISGTLHEINAQVLNRLLNGWDDSLPFHEKQRRYAELCNELVIQDIHGRIAGSELPHDTVVNEVSDYPLTLDKGTAESIGYRSGNYKGMVRSTHLRSEGGGQYTRLIEQASRSNGTWVNTFDFLKSAGIPVANGSGDIAVLNAPFIYRQRDYRDGVVDIMRLLDNHAGEGVRYGDIGEKASKHVAYELLRQESIRRENETESYYDKLADLETQLDEMLETGQISYPERMKIFKEQIKTALESICTLAPEYAEDTFGEAAAPYFYQAAELAASGNAAGACDLLAATEHLQETITFCGVSFSVEVAQEKGLKVNSYLQFLENGKNGWKWKEGTCIVQDCPTRPKKVQVGPCSVCKGCQNIYDQGLKPKDVYRRNSRIVRSHNKKDSDWQRIKREEDVKAEIQKQHRLASLEEKRKRQKLARQEQLRLQELGRAA